MELILKLLIKDKKSGSKLIIYKTNEWEVLKTSKYYWYMLQLNKFALFILKNY